MTFVNRYGITLAADLYKTEKCIWEISCDCRKRTIWGSQRTVFGLYAQTMAERGYLTIAFDPSLRGKWRLSKIYGFSDINTEDFMAAVDFLSVREDVDPDKIGIIGICGWGGMALNQLRWIQE